MLLKYIAQSSFTTTSGVTFNTNEVHEVQDSVGKALLETFIGMFEDCTPKAEIKVDKKPKETK